ncbi:methyltransferase-domain-containing protein [Apodospora peruviana]|uniref:Ribosomal RNA-processing protein 8 n=1 Tax=Apodospora peruviana TaxID=516989 RepID=A0AAE0I4C2_9PEZI|nr:methyltransferase-domain-containing protein [Apodospora peruviana]
MFPVRGLSVSADKLKVETVIASPAASTPSSSQARKRKRASQSQTVTQTNVTDLWEKVIEHKKPAGPGPDGKAQSKNKKAKVSALAADDDKNVDDDDEWNGIDDDDAAEATPETATTKPDTEKRERKNRKKKLNADDTPPTAEQIAAAKATKEKAKQLAEKIKQTGPPPVTAAKLTPLQAAMREKLVSARFRHLNETLYTRPSAEAFHLFEDSPEMFTEYHEGFRRQVEVWPENPVESYIREIKTRGAIRNPPRSRHDFSNPIDSHLLPLPRKNGTCYIADLGCGDAALAKALEPIKQKLHLSVRSYDLQTGGNPLITRADIANLQLPGGSFDVVIFCLALMGTNWIDFVEEAYRILRWKGELWVAEIKSRFAAPRKRGSHQVVSHSVGNRKKVGAVPKKLKGRELQEQEEAEQAELAVAVDGVELRRQETDVSAFVEVLRKRGFALHREMGAGAMDMNNKMFVKMRFVKATPAIKGKCVAEAPKDDGLGAQGPPKKAKFLPEEDDQINEAAVLKPCVYKLR